MHLIKMEEGLSSGLDHLGFLQEVIDCKMTRPPGVLFRGLLLHRTDEMVLQAAKHGIR